MEYLKAEQTGSAKFRVCAIPFGGEFKGSNDIQRERFTDRTDPKPHWFKERPVIFHHGMDEDLGDEELGVEGEITKEKDGWWAEMWLNRQHRYFNQIETMIRRGKMYGSSGSMPHLVKTAPDGEILVWPHVEQTLTFTPANRLARVSTAKALDHFSLAGIELDPALRGVLAELDTLTNDLESDLPSGGGDPAVSRLSATLDRLDEVLGLIA